MGLFNNTGGIVKDTAGAIGTLAKDLRTAITGKPSPEMEAKLKEIAIQADKLQTEINKNESQNPSLFVSGWRPFIGWICGAGLGYEYIIQPIFTAIVQIFSTYQLPHVQTEAMYPLIMGLLGLGAQRTVEKLKKVNRS